MGNPHAGFDEAGAGNGLLGTAPAFDPTLGGEGTEKSLTYPTSTVLKGKVNVSL